MIFGPTECFAPENANFNEKDEIQQQKMEQWKNLVRTALNEPKFSVIRVACTPVLLQPLLLLLLLLAPSKWLK